jgi:hypothetical protein
VRNGSITPGSNLSKFNEVVNTPAQSYELAVQLGAWRMLSGAPVFGEPNTLRLLHTLLGDVC